MRCYSTIKEQVMMVVALSHDCVLELYIQLEKYIKIANWRHNCTCLISCRMRSSRRLHDISKNERRVKCYHEKVIEL